MAYTARQLIIESWYLSGIVSRTMETVTGEQIADGLERFNAILDVATASVDLIPFWVEYNSVFVAGQEKYSIDNLVEIESATFFIDDGFGNNVRYSMQPASRQEYFAYSRANTILSLPYQWHMERTHTGADVYFYYFPQTNWNFQLWAKFSLLNLTLGTDLTLTYQGFYIEYLKYKLANYLCELYNVAFSLTHAKRLSSYEQMIRNASPLDFTQKKISQFQVQTAPDYAQANLGKSFVPLGY